MSDENLMREGEAPVETLSQDAVDEREMLSEIAENIDAAEEGEGKPPVGETRELEDVNSEAAEKAEEEAAPEETVSSGWAAIRKADKRLRSERDELRKMRHEIQQAKESFETQGKSQADVIESLKANPLAFLEAQGISFDKLAEQVIDGKVPDQSVSKLEARFEALEKENAELKKHYQASQQDKLVQDFRAEVKGVLAKDEYALLSAYPDAEAEIETFAGQYFSSYGEALPIPQIADILQDRWRERLSTLRSNQAVRKALGLAEDSNNQSVAPATSTSRPKVSKTLTKKHSSPVGAPLGKSEGSTVREEDELTEAAKLIPGDIWSNFD